MEQPGKPGPNDSIRLKHLLSEPLPSSWKEAIVQTRLLLDIHLRGGNSMTEVSGRFREDITPDQDVEAEDGGDVSTSTA